MSEEKNDENNEKDEINEKIRTLEGLKLHVTNIIKELLNPLSEKNIEFQKSEKIKEETIKADKIKADKIKADKIKADKIKAKENPQSNKVDPLSVLTNSPTSDPKNQPPSKLIDFVDFVDSVDSVDDSANLLKETR